MSLSAVVAFAQQNFDSLLEDSRDRDDALPALAAAERANLPSSRRELPVWLRERNEEQELPQDSEDPWIIEDRIEAPKPQPEVSIPDALAFYVPFHFYRKGWGIFIRMSGVAYLAEKLKGGILKPGDESYLYIAENILTEHEWHHASTEIACTRAELTARRLLYQQYFCSAEAAFLEESLANARAINWSFQADDPPEAKRRAEVWMSTQGPGYCEYGSVLSSRKFSQGLDRAARLMTAVLPEPSPRADSSLHTFLFRGADRYPSMPRVRINDLHTARVTGVSVLRPFPKAYGVQVRVHSNDHPPPHIHVLLSGGGEETRYSWPDLIPLSGNRPLPGPAAKGLRQYIEAHGPEIAARVQAVYGIGT